MKFENLNNTQSVGSEGDYIKVKFKNGSNLEILHSSELGKNILIRNRKSIYDNHKLVDLDETSSLSNSNSNSSSSSSDDYDSEESGHTLNQKSFITEKSININQESTERDDFDDLIDLTHRAPKKDFKKNLKPELRSQSSSLPPLPYSFVKLDKPKNVQIKPTNHKSELNKQLSTTRLIIPINSNDNTKQEIQFDPKKFEPDKNEVIQEWDQISKIFASLETLLNEVVESTSKNLENKSILVGKNNDEIKYKTLDYKTKSNDSNNISQYSYRTLSTNSSSLDSSINSSYLNNNNNNNNNHNKFYATIDPSNKNKNYLKNMKNLKYLELSDYLKKINMEQYEFKFLTNGFDDLNYMNNIITLQDLIQIGIDDYNDIFTILNEIKKLPSSIKRINDEYLKFNNIEEWLNFLNLTEYIDNFLINNIDSMEKVKNLWEIELTTILQIPFIGHRRRIMCSIQACLKLDTEGDCIPDTNQLKINIKDKKQRNYSADSHSTNATRNSIIVNFSNHQNLKQLPKHIWNNDSQSLIKNSHNFIVYYLGSSAITKLKTDQDPIKYTIDRLKNTSKCTPYQLPKVELAISINGVKLLNYKTKDLLCNYDIKHINNVCQDQDDLNFFAFSTQTDPSAHYYCHVFSCKDNQLSTQIILTIGQAFDIAYELFCKNNI